MDAIVRILGAETVDWSFKTECCGTSMTLTRSDMVLKLSNDILREAKEAGANVITVACPLCQANLDSRQEDISRQAGKKYDLPILYFTELIGLSLGHPDSGKWFKRHFVDPTNLLLSKGLI